MTAPATSNPSESGPALPVAAILDRPRSQWPAWLTAMAWTIILLLQCLAGVSIAYFSRVMAESNRNIEKTNEGLLNLGNKVEANTREMQTLNKALGKFDLLDQRLLQLEDAKKDFEERLRDLERAR